MAKPAQPIHRFHETSVEQDAISPSVRIRRSWRTRHHGTRAGELVYTENLWAAVNNTLAGCTEFNEWQAATQWVLVTSGGQRGEGVNMLSGCEAIAGSDADVHMTEASAITATLTNLSANQATVFVVAIESSLIEAFAEAMDEWLQSAASNDSARAAMHLLWLPRDRAAQSFPIQVHLESLCWESLTIACDLASFSGAEDELKESLVIMLRAAVFIDPQFAHWLEGNLSAMAEQDDEAHKKAIMRTANTLFTVKRRRSEEPDIPMSFTDSVALRLSAASDPATPIWKIKARQLLLDVSFASHANRLSDSAVERIKRMMQALDLIDAATDSTLVACEDPDPKAYDNKLLVLTEIGNAQFTHDFDLSAWHQANQ